MRERTPCNRHHSEPVTTKLRQFSHRVEGAVKAANGEKVASVTPLGKARPELTRSDLDAVMPPLGERAANSRRRFVMRAALFDLATFSADVARGPAMRRVQCSLKQPAFSIKRK
jgi:hypothetical protein